MFVRKRTKLRIAYSLLTITSLSIIAHDAQTRGNLRTGPSEAHRAQFDRTSAPLPITPLAQSPFDEARPEHTIALASSRAHTEQPQISKSVVPSSVWFLTVALKVDTGTKSVALSRGTRVHLVGERDGKFLVRRNGTDFLVEKTHITDDIGSLTKLAHHPS
jgi:hypothetical protein